MKILRITAAAIAVAGFTMAAPVVAQQTGPGPGNPPAAAERARFWSGVQV